VKQIAVEGSRAEICDEASVARDDRHKGEGCDKGEDVQHQTMKHADEHGSDGTRVVGLDGPDVPLELVEALAKDVERHEERRENTDEGTRARNGAFRVRRGVNPLDVFGLDHSEAKVKVQRVHEESLPIEKCVSIRRRRRLRKPNKQPHRERHRDNDPILQRRVH